MPDTHRIQFVPTSQAARMNALCKNDYGNSGKGDLTYTVPFIFVTDPDTHPGRGFACGWNQEDADYARLETEGRRNAATDFVSYPTNDPLQRQWTFEEALADTTRKPTAYRLIPSGDVP